MYFKTVTINRRSIMNVTEQVYLKFFFVILSTKFPTVTDRFGHKSVDLSFCNNVYQVMLNFNSIDRFCRRKQQIISQICYYWHDLPFQLNCT